MDTITVFGILISKITIVSNKVKSILSGIDSITNVDNKLHYEFTDGTDADFDVVGDAVIEIIGFNYSDEKLQLVFERVV